eukprot:m.875794 g.875794  ORF g.875794 m.875794 type:complete len:696 (-) comp59810_c0_seq53:1573-3660(-)
MKRDYALLQTLDDHSKAVSAIRFVFRTGSDALKLLSCSMDKSLIFRKLDASAANPQFIQTQLVRTKHAIHDLDVECTHKYAATVGADKCLRVYDVGTGIELHSYKATIGDEGSVMTCAIDPSGLFVATSNAANRIRIFNFYTGDCIAVGSAHSDTITCVRFLADGRHLLSVSQDGSVLIWKLPVDLTHAISNHFEEVMVSLSVCATPGPQRPSPPSQDPSLPAPATPVFSQFVLDPRLLPMWARKQVVSEQIDDREFGPAPQGAGPKGKWMTRVPKGEFVIGTALAQPARGSLSQGKRLTIEPSNSPLAPAAAAKQQSSRKSVDLDRTITGPQMTAPIFPGVGESELSDSSSDASEEDELFSLHSSDEPTEDHEAVASLGLDVAGIPSVTESFLLRESISTAHRHTSSSLGDRSAKPFMKFASENATEHLQRYTTQANRECDLVREKLALGHENATFIKPRTRSSPLHSARSSESSSSLAPLSVIDSPLDRTIVVSPHASAFPEPGATVLLAAPTLHHSHQTVESSTTTFIVGGPAAQASSSTFIVVGPAAQAPTTTFTVPREQQVEPAAQKSPSRTTPVQDSPRSATTRATTASAVPPVRKGSLARSSRALPAIPDSDSPAAIREATTRLEKAFATALAHHEVHFLPSNALVETSPGFHLSLKFDPEIGKRFQRRDRSQEAAGASLAEHPGVSG